MSHRSVEQTNKKKPSRLRALIADDVKESRRSTRLMLSLVPDVEVVAIAHDGREAVKLARQHEVQIALLDIKMPVLDGLQATQAILKRDPDVCCVMISAERDSDTLQRALTAGASGYLIKPFTSDELVETMERVIKDVRSKQARYGTATRLKRERDAYVLELAKEYMKARRTDEKAQTVFETLAADPYCDIRWLRNLAIIYVVRGVWGRLRVLAERLERQML